MAAQALKHQKRRFPARAVDCSAAARAASNETELLCHTQQLLKDKYGPALLFTTTKPDPASGELVCGGLDGSCIMDPHPDLPYLEHVLDMARTSMAKAPSSGACIDRQDWIGMASLAAGESFINVPSPLNVLRNTYDHSSC